MYIVVGVCNPGIAIYFLPGFSKIIEALKNILLKIPTDYRRGSRILRKGVASGVCKKFKGHPHSAGGLGNPRGSHEKKTMGYKPIIVLQ